ncbi:MAG: hypothetical protein COA69_11600 [Robiginitomaculum sp.]|nr:MAG: hypothetical protein COA69_11600 [Robiginitomaculum sp.]
MAIPVSIVVSGCTTNRSVVDVRPYNIGNNGNVDLGAVRDRAALFYERGTFISAYTDYKTVVLQMPKDKDYPALLGFADAALALAGLGEQYADEARIVYENLVATDGLSNPLKIQAETGLILLDVMAADRGESPEISASETSAEALIMRALDTNPQDPRLWNALGRAYDRKQNWISALESYVTALRLSHDNTGAVAPVQNNMGMSLLLQGRTEEALVKFRQAHMANPEIQLYDNNTRLALILSDDFATALEGLDDIPMAQLYNDAGFIAAGHGDVARARGLYEKAIEINPLYFEIAEQNLAALD